MRSTNWRKYEDIGRVLALIGLGLAIWIVIGDVFTESRFLISTPSDVLAYARSNFTDLLLAFITTTCESVVGLGVAILVALTAVIAGLYSASFYRWILPAAVASQVIPLVSLAPFFILAFGLGFTGKVAMAATMCFFPIFVNLSTGVMNISQAVRDLLYVYAFSKSQCIFRVYLPLSVPNMFAGLRIASTLAVIGSIVAEFNGADQGLGKNLFLAAKRLEPELMVASLALSTILGGLLYLSMNLVERRIGRWYIVAQSQFDSHGGMT